MNILKSIHDKVQQRKYELSKHAVDQSILRNINIDEIEEAIENKSEIIENYRDDKYGSSCLILGFTKSGRLLHIQCSYPNRPLLKIITLYEPDPDLWINFKIRSNKRRGII